ncbi:MAG: ABC transporter permease [Thermoleophilia bacterium]|nr:ABC transporter permease [Thermoleophilia bacterium]
MVFKQARRNLLSNKLRLFLTSLAVVLGVGFVTGSIVLADTINKSFSNIFNVENSQSAVQVRGKAVVSESDRKPVPADVLEKVRRVPGVRAAEGTILGQAQVVDAEGKAVGGGGAPTMGFNWYDGPTNPMQMVEGNPPRENNEVVLDTETAKKAGVPVGGEVTVVTDVGPAKYRLSGTAKFGKTGQAGGATLAFFTLDTAKRVFTSSGRFATLDVAADPGVSDTKLAADVQKVLPAGFEAVTATQANEEVANQFQSFIDIFRNVLLVFAGIALFVGAFIIFNAFQITIAQRGRQIGLLRAQGASSRQIMGSVILEALMVGIVASLLGVAFGIVVAWALQQLFNAVGADLPDQSLVITTGAIISGLIVGILVTLLSAVGPAYRSSRVSPMSALHPAPVGPTSRWRIALAIAMAVAGVAMVLWGTFGDMDTAPRSTLLALGSIILFFGAAALTQYVASPLANGIGRLFGPRGGRMPLRLGRRNAMRHPHRTAQTAAALTIGVALVTAVSIFASSLHKTFVGSIEDRLHADVVAFAQGSGGFTVAADDVVLKVPQITDVLVSRTAAFRDEKGAQWVSGVVPDRVDEVYDAGVEEGSLGDLASPDTVAVSRDRADSMNLKVGSMLPMTFASTGEKPRRVVAIFKDSTFGNYFMSNEQIDANSTQLRNQGIFAKAAPGVSPDEAKEAVKKALASFPSVEVYTRQGYIDLIGNQVNQLLAMFYLLLAMAIFIAVFGIILTLALSVFERTREIGLLRAVGLSRRGTRAMIRWEAVIVALIGALVGLVVGTFLGVVAVKAFPDLTAIGIPWLSMIAFVIVAALFGVLAAILPARRAAKLNVLEAIASE